LPDATYNLAAAKLGPDRRPALMDQNSIDALTGRRAVWIVYGNVKYRDAFSLFFGSTRIGFCFQFVPELAPKANFRPCDQRNLSYIHNWIYF
jgi:hypothetical protein